MYYISPNTFSDYRKTRRSLSVRRRLMLPKNFGRYGFWLTYKIGYSQSRQLVGGFCEWHPPTQCYRATSLNHVLSSPTLDNSHAYPLFSIRRPCCGGVENCNFWLHQNRAPTKFFCQQSNHDRIVFVITKVSPYKRTIENLQRSYDTKYIVQFKQIFETPFR